MKFRNLCLLLGSALLSTAPAMAQEGQKSVVRLPKDSVIPVLSQHDKPGPFPILPMWELGWTPAEMPYRRDKLRPGAGVLDTIMSSAAPVKIGGGYTSSGSAKEAFGQASLRTAAITLQANANYENAGKYEDGSGEEVRTGYDRHTEQLVMAYRPADTATITAMLLRDRIDDHQLPLTNSVRQSGLLMAEGFGADPVRTERTLGQLAAESTKQLAGLDRLRMEVRYVGLERIANNFDLRPETAAVARNIAKPSRYEIGGKIIGESAFTDDLAGRLSLSSNRVWHDAIRYGGPGVNNLNVITGYQYPGVLMWENAANFDLAWQAGEKTNVNLGVKYDYVTSKAEKMDNNMAIGAFNGSVRSLYETYFGPVKSNSEEHLVSVKLDGERKMADDRLSLTGSVGRIMRAADTQERYFALPSTTGTASVAGTQSRQVGNPNIDPEAHYRAEAGIALKGTDWLDYGRKRPGGDDWHSSQSWRLSLSGHVDQVQNFITRDRAHGQSGVLQNDHAFIWRNVDARLAGAEAEAGWNLTRNWSTRLAVSYRWGENTSDGRALYGIDPLEANWLIDYQNALGAYGTWNAGLKLRAVAGQNRQDADPTVGSGFDAENRGGFTLLDLYFGMQVMDKIGLRLGIDNVFDKTYAEHNPINATDDANPLAVNGPGRSFYARAVATF